jgi:hypothetical protein
MRAFRIALLVFVSICTVLGYSRTRAENLEAGKSAQKLFSSNCAQCHSNPRALARHMSNWALTGFLQEHYTASQTAAYELAAYLTAIGNKNSRETERPMARRDGPRQSWANQSGDPVERPPEIVPVR